MTKSKVLSVVLAGAMVAAMGAVSLSANAAPSYGVIGTVNGNWDTDTVMTDEDGDGIYTCTIKLEAGTYTWKVRADGSWEKSWGDPDEDGTTWNSQDDCDLVAEEDGTYEFKFDTTASDDMTWTCSVAKATDEEEPTEESKEEPTEESKDVPATGDTTSAFALVGVVVAALGVAVVMTKKASVK